MLVVNVMSDGWSNCIYGCTCTGVRVSRRRGAIDNDFPLAEGCKKWFAENCDGSSVVR